MKLNQKQTLVFAIALVAAALSAFPLQAAIGQRTSTVLLEDTTTLALSWSEIRDRFRRQEVPGGSRGNLSQPIVCAVVPGMLVDRETDAASPLQVWGLNPVFVWQEPWTHLEVFRSRDHEVLLSQALTPEARHLVYDEVENAIPLEPGGSYYWKLSRDGSDGQEPTFGETTFRTLDEEARLELEEALAVELAAVDDSESVLSKRVSFFVERELWADVFIELHTADELPDDLERLKDAISGHDFCAQPREISLAHRRSALP